MIPRNRSYFRLKFYGLRTIIIVLEIYRINFILDTYVIFAALFLQFEWAKVALQLAIFLAGILAISVKTLRLIQLSIWHYWQLNALILHEKIEFMLFIGLLKYLITGKLQILCSWQFKFWHRFSSCLYQIL